MKTVKLYACNVGPETWLYAWTNRWDGDSWIPQAANDNRER